MAEFTVTGFTFILNVLAVMTQDVTPHIYCNKNKQTWQDAWADCTSVNGQLVAFDTGIGVKVDDIRLNRGADIWTADYAWKKGWNENDRLCGFEYMSKNMLFSQEMFGNCYVERYYFCKDATTDKLYVLNGTRDRSSCNEVITLSYLQLHSQNIIPGLYWTKNIFNLSAGALTRSQTPILSPTLCGAYKRDIGQYFIDCFTRRSSLCSINSNNRKNFDKSCFDYRLENSTVKPELYTTESTPKQFMTTVQETVTRTPTSLKTVDTTIKDIETTSANHVTVTKAAINLHTVTHFNGTTASDDGILDEQRENDSNLGETIGLPVGICMVLICGIILSIYILRRYKCWKTRSGTSDPKEAVSWNNVSSKGQEMTNVDKNCDNSSVHVLDRRGHNDESTRKNDKLFKKPIPEYAVVHKNNLKHMTQGQKGNMPSKEKRNMPVLNSNNLNLDESSSYCYAKVGNTDNLNQFANSNEIQTSSEYSFAKETTEDMDDNKEELANVKEDEYDVANNVPSYKTDNNIYNHLQTKDHEERHGHSFNVYNISQNETPETVYDSTKQIDHSEPTDNIYNQLSQTETYSTFSTRNENRIPKSKPTDQTYGELK